LILFAFLLFVLSLFFTKVVDGVLPADPLFFTKNLSISYWFSLVTLLILFLLRLTFSIDEELSRVTDISLIFSLVIMVYGMPSFVYKNPLYVDAYIHTSASLKILLCGTLHQPIEYPGGYFFFAIFMLVTGLDPHTFMQLFPLLRASVLMFILYVVSLRFANSKYAILSPFIYTAFTQEIFHVYPASLTHCFYVLFLLFALFLTERGERVDSKALMLLLASSSIVTYILAPPLFLFCSLLLFFLQMSKLKMRLPIIIFVIWITWLLYTAEGSLNLIVHQLIEALKEPSTHLPTSIITLPEARKITLMIKQAQTIFVIFTGLLIIFLCFIYCRKFVLSVQEKLRMIISGGSFIMTSSLLLASLLISPDPSTRFYVYLLTSFSILIPTYISIVRKEDRLKNLRINRITTFTFLFSTIFFVILNPMVRNDINSAYYYPSSSLKGADFAIEYLEGGDIVWVRDHVHLLEYAACRRGILFIGHMGYQYNEAVRYISLGKYLAFRSEETFLSYFSEKIVNQCNALIFNDFEDQLMNLIFGEENYKKARILYEQYVSERLNKVYTSGTLRIYN